eukprot:1196342-Prorocentrum_minimum.AAC.6
MRIAKTTNAKSARLCTLAVGERSTRVRDIAEVYDPTHQSMSLFERAPLTAQDGPIHRVIHLSYVPHSSVGLPNGDVSVDSSLRFRMETEGAGVLAAAVARRAQLKDEKRLAASRYSTRNVQSTACRVR